MHVYVDIYNDLLISANLCFHILFCKCLYSTVVHNIHRLSEVLCPQAKYQRMVKQLEDDLKKEKEDIIKSLNRKHQAALASSAVSCL